MKVKCFLDDCVYNKHDFCESDVVCINSTGLVICYEPKEEVDKEVP